MLFKWNFAPYIAILCALLSFYSYSEEALLRNQFNDVRIYHETEAFVHGYMTKKTTKKGDFFTINKGDNLMHFGDEIYKKESGLYRPIYNKNINDLKSSVLPYFIDRYGISVNRTSEKSSGKPAVVFLDYACEFSRQFVERGEVDRLQRDGYDVTIIPISRDATTKGILDYSALICSDVSQVEKSKRFFGWMKNGYSNTTADEIKNSKCYYWLDVKPLYGLIPELGIKGLPSVLYLE